MTIFLILPTKKKKSFENTESVEVAFGALSN